MNPVLRSQRGYRLQHCSMWQTMWQNIQISPLNAIFFSPCWSIRLIIHLIQAILARGENNRTEQFCNCPDNAITFAWNEMFTWSCPCIFSHLGASLLNVGQIPHPHAPALFPTPTKYPTFTNLIWRTHDEFVAQEIFKRQLFISCQSSFT